MVIGHANIAPRDLRAAFVYRELGIVVRNCYSERKHFRDTRSCKTIETLLCASTGALDDTCRAS